MTTELTITRGYIDWGIWEAVREILQNAHDEDRRGAPMNVEYYPRTERLVVTNDHTKLDRDKLLLGQTDKRDDDRTIGEFGEGFKLAFAALLQNGCSITVDTGIPVKVIRDDDGNIDKREYLEYKSYARKGDEIKTERWSPSFKTSDSFGGEETLHVQTRLVEYREGVTFEIEGVSPEDWETVQRRILFLGDDEEDGIIETDRGRILKNRPGQVFHKGIFVAELGEDCEWGYDLKYIDVDRDRNMVRAYEVQDEVRDIISDAHKHGLIEDAFDIMRSGKLEAQALDSIVVGEGVKHDIIEEFKDRYGDHAVPVRNTSQAREAEYYGLKGVQLPDDLFSFLTRHYRSFDEAKENQAITEIVQYHELNEEERHALDQAIDLIPDDIGCPEFDVQVVEFPDSDTYGRAHDDGTIEINRRVLESERETLATLAHEIAHISGADDFTVAHRNLTESILAEIAVCQHQ